MAWLTVDKDGQERIWNECPIRHPKMSLGWWTYPNNYTAAINLPNGCIEKIIGKKLTWADEPYEMEE